MKRNLMIKILELLEEVYPENYKVERLVKRLRLNFPNKEFSKIIAYLASTSKIQIKINESVPGILLTSRPNDEIYITYLGIDFLSEIKKLEMDEKKSNAITKATVVLALTGVIQALIYFQQFSKDVHNLNSWFALVAIGVLLMIIFLVAWSSLIDILIPKSFKIR